MDDRPPRAEWTRIGVTDELGRVEPWGGCALAAGGTAAAVAAYNLVPLGPRTTWDAIPWAAAAAGGLLLLTAALLPIRAETPRRDTVYAALCGVAGCAVMLAGLVVAVLLNPGPRARESLIGPGLLLALCAIPGAGCAALVFDGGVRGRRAEKVDPLLGVVLRLLGFVLLGMVVVQALTPPFV